jgi:hypothetical protein
MLTFVFHGNIQLSFLEKGQMVTLELNLWCNPAQNEVSQVP